MPVFDTPEPITVDLYLSVGDVTLAATDRVDTLVDVRPRNPGSKADVLAAEQTTVEYADGRLVIKASKSWRRYSWISSGPSIDIRIELPSDSQLLAEASWASLRGSGRLGNCRITSSGSIRLDRTEALDITSSHGDIVADHITGAARVTSSSGTIRLGEIDGASEIKNSSGSCSVKCAAGDIRISTASGDITIDQAFAGVTARTAHGGIRVGEVRHGSIDLQNSYGAIEVGVRAGTSAWLDLGSRHGRVHHELENTGGPSDTDDTVEIRAHTTYGEVFIRRS